MRTKAVVKTETVAVLTEDQTATIMRDQAKLAKSGIDRDYLLLAEALFEIKHKEYYRKWGIDTFATYCDHELEIQSAKATMLTRIWDAMKALALPREELIKIGYTKASLLIKDIEGGGDVRELIDLAKKNSTKELQTILRDRHYTHRVDTVGASDIIIKYEAASGHNQLVSQALGYAKKHFETENPSEALALILNDWMINQETSTDNIPLETHLAFLRRRFKVDIIVAGTIDDDLSDIYVEDDIEEVEAGVI